MATKLVVTIPVADLRGEPEDLKNDYTHQDLRQTQALFGEELNLLEEKNEWLKVAALEQPHFTDAKGWHFYEGWIKKEECIPVDSFQQKNFVVAVPYVTIFPQNIPLLFGTTVLRDSLGNLILPDGQIAHCSPKALRPLPTSINRKLLIQDAKLFLKLPYLWGGRSFHVKNRISSVDCSGLINLIYRAQGKLIPRDAHPQHLKSKEISSLLPGDLLYVSKGTKVSHVVLKIEGSYYLDSSESEGHVRYLKWGEDIWEKEGKYFIKNPKIPFIPFLRSFL